MIINTLLFRFLCYSGANTFFRFLFLLLSKIIRAACYSHLGPSSKRLKIYPKKTFSLPYPILLLMLNILVFCYYWLSFFSIKKPFRTILKTFGMIPKVFFTLFIANPNIMITDLDIREAIFTLFITNSDIMMTNSDVRKAFRIIPKAAEIPFIP